MGIAELNLECAWALVDGLVAGGVRHACLSPGSRSTSLALALARHPDVELHVHLDERSSGFFAIGLSRSTRTPVAIACTSGTAAAEFLPAVVEASQSRVPLVVLTADRPPQLRGTGANQTIDQVGLYGSYVRGALDLPVPETTGQDAWWRQAAREALEATRSDPVGPVHVNCRFEEPLSPAADVTLPAPTGEQLELSGRPEAELTEEEADRLAELVSGARGAVVIGGWPGDLTGAAAFWSQQLGWPVIAEPTSTARVPDAALTAGQALIGDQAWIARHTPDVVIQLGAAPTSRVTQGFVASAERLVVADRWHLDADPQRRSSWRLAVDADALQRALADRPVDQLGAVVWVGTRPSEDDAGDLPAHRLHPAPTEWTAAWREGDVRVRRAMDGFLDGIDEPFEPRIARDVAACIPDGGTLFVGNSTPIRDLDLAMAPRSGLRVIANRGASGIDGLVSTALGVAAGGAREPGAPGDRPVVALIGDLSFLHDLGAVAWNARRSIDLTIVVVRNGGGEIFSLLPQRSLPEHRDLFVTPHEADIGALSSAAGARHTLVGQASELAPAVAAASDGGLHIIEVAVDPKHTLALRADLAQTISDALDGAE